MGGENPRASEGGQDTTGRLRVSVAEAADLLGSTVEAVRKRVSRNSIPHERDEDGRVWVLLGADRTRPDIDQDTGRQRPDAHEDLIDELRDRVRFLEGELERRGEEAARYQEIVGRLSIANAQLSARLPELEAAPEASEEPPTEATDEQQGRGPIPEDTSPQAAPERRSWWSRMFGGG